MKKYIILKDWHYSLVLMTRLFSWFYDEKKFKIQFKFSKDCWYPKTDNNEHYNKLTGISFGVFEIHRNSIRICWKPNFLKNGKIQLYGYVYDNNIQIFESKFLCEVDVEKEYTCILSIENKIYKLDMGDMGTIEMENNLIDSKIQKQIYPYFGGISVAPQNMEIWVEMKKI